MAGDNKSRAYSPDEKHKHVFVCKKWPQLRVVYVRVGEEKHVKGQAEKYLGFLQTAAGGIYQTNSDAIAEYLENLDQFKDGEIVKLTHEELGKLLRIAPSEERVSTGPVGTLADTPSKADPEAPSETEPAPPKPARGARRKADPVA